MHFFGNQQRNVTGLFRLCKDSNSSEVRDCTCHQFTVARWEGRMEAEGERKEGPFSNGVI